MKKLGEIMDYKENKREDGITLLGLLIIIFAILLIIMVAMLVVFTKMDENSEENLLSSNVENNVENNTTKRIKNYNSLAEETTNTKDVEQVEKDEEDTEEKVAEENGVIKPIKLNIGEKETMESGGEILHINDYEIIIPDTFVKAGYDITEDGDALNFKVKDGSYECVLLQISDTYVMPTEEEINNFYETEEYKTWDEEEVDYDDDEALEAHYDRYDEMSTKYYKSLGYTPQDCPDYTLKDDELNPLIEKYFIDRDSHSSGVNNVFPGYYYYRNYDWGKMKLYTIPRYYNDSEFGENTSDFSICLYMFEYYDTEDMSIYDLDLVTF